MIIRLLIILVIIMLTAVPAPAGRDKILQGFGVGNQSGLSDGKIGEGLKEALKVGTRECTGYRKS